MHGTAEIETNLDNVDVYIDSKFVGRISSGHSLSVPGLSSGPHKVDGVREGYQPDHKEILIAPGQKATVTLRIRYAREIKKAALDLDSRGERLAFAHRSSLNLLRIESVQGGQSENDMKRARELFARSLKEDPDYSTAAFHLASISTPSN